MCVCVCVFCYPEQRHDICHTISLRAISGCWGFSKFLLFSLKFREHFCMSSIYENKATTQRKILSQLLEMSSILLACWLQGYILFVQTL